jgi:peptidoglycan/LPS O-acetylase OafA/YrhL
MNSKLDQEVTRAERPHFAAVDGVRGIAILIVLMRHCLSAEVSQKAGPWSIISANMVGSLGWGVVLFFVLSGFLITGILLDSKGSPNYYVSFYGRRMLRIFPLYYGTILIFTVTALFHGLGVENKHFLERLPWLLTYTTNILIARHNDWTFVFNGHSLAHFWSLAVEEQFYFIWPFIVLRCSSEVLKRICLIAIIGGFASRTILLYGFDNFLGAITFLPCQSDALAMGALLAILVREREELVAALAWPVALAGGAFWMVTLLDRNLLMTAGITGFGLMSVGALMLSLYRPISRFFSISILRTFGKYSYGMYVWHVIILPFAQPLQAKMGKIGFMLFFIILSLGVGWLSWHLFEAHFLKLKKFFPVASKRAWTPGLQLAPKKKPEPIFAAT